MKKAKAKTKTKPVSKPKLIRPPLAEQEADRDREAVLDEREQLSKQFPPRYGADVAIFPGDKVEVMLRLTYSQAEALARLLKDSKL